jgi:hypothetical protein
MDMEMETDNSLAIFYAARQAIDTPNVQPLCDVVTVYLAQYCAGLR